MSEAPQTERSGMPALALCFERIAVRRLRNITALDLEPAPRLNVVVGDNGQGKTSLLEALYVVATTKSFRSERLAPIVQSGAEQALVVATIREALARREQRATLHERGRTVLLDGKRPSSLAHYATRTPVVVFHPADLELVSGAATPRRKLLDRIGLFVDPPGALAHPAYTRAQRARQRILEERGTLARELDAFERVMAQEGARLALTRARAFGALDARLGPALARVAAPETRVLARYLAGGPSDAGEFARRLLEARAIDARRGSASIGPQRDEIEIVIDGRPARFCASQGQQRLVTLALKLAELECVREARGAHPVLLLDDVSSELDPARTSAVYSWLRETESQVFVTTTRPELFPEAALSASERADFTLVRGGIERRA